MRRRLRGVLWTALAVLLPTTPAHAAPPAPAADSVLVPPGIGVPSAPVANVDGVPMVAVNELARLLGATKFWRPDVRKIVLRAG